MKRIKLYEAIVETKTSVFKMVRPSTSLEEFENVYRGNGDFVRIKEVTNDYPIDIVYLRQVLQNAHFGEVEQDIIVSLVQNIY